MAIAIGLLGYSMLLTWQHGHLAVATQPTWQDFSAIPPASPLPRTPDAGPPPVPSGAGDNDGITSIRVRIKNLPTALRTAAAGVSTFASKTGADFHWTALGDTAVATDGSLTLQLATRALDITATLASSQEFARHGYLVRNQLSIRADATQTAEVTLDAAATSVQFLLPANATFAGPFCLRRIDDASWLPMATGSAGLTFAPGQARHVLLGAGAYVLCDALVPEHAQRFDVPAIRDVAISPELARVPADHP